ncbi:MAG: hypothetical protein KKE02_11215 [Alphaproteobacteria bacterium]|nr:hypothetical protein [Alphaproteobacteria bacterium]MBU1512474.1 hypothetical protein [Alphaproteobacteria bacterium]MBU2096602.1 hypothetical protein [Alphaproteobacteria bacterium]MBU2151580.1 hypothetical protein [Alphaproteobacteria bacterium]MBU2307297.1 hypothetical protein [Alphaproteobacteria bacterium]
MNLYRTAGLALALLCISTSATAAASKFALEYRVERAATARLSVATCLDTAKRASTAIGYQPAVENHYPGQLAVFASGPAAGGSSLTVYCIAVDQKTAFVVQAIDYSRPNSPAAARVADRVHSALMAAAGGRVAGK